MPVRIKQKIRYQGTITPENLNQETTVVDLADQADDYIVEGYISLRNMQSGDAVIIRTYIAVDGVNQDRADEASFSGPQLYPVIRIPAATLPYNGRFKVTLTQTAGSLKSFPYVVIVQIMEVL